MTTSVFPSDSQTRRFLAAQGREKDWVPLAADADAVYDKEVTIDLGKLEPLASVPHNPGNVKRVADIEGIPVDQVCIGSCTNSSYKDLMTVAHILKGRVAAPGLSFVVAPGSKQVLENVLEKGGLANLISAGARIAEVKFTFEPSGGNNNTVKIDSVEMSCLF